jgi:hypothetical protein
MKIIALFGIRAYAPDLPELLVAWDEYSVDENGAGWEDAKAEATAEIGDELLTHAVIKIDVDEVSILSILRPIGTVKGTVKRLDEHVCR